LSRTRNENKNKKHNPGEKNTSGECEVQMKLNAAVIKNSRGFCGELCGELLGALLSLCDVYWMKTLRFKLRRSDFGTC
jgi:hypothetical protein